MTGWGGGQHSVRLTAGPLRDVSLDLVLRSALVRRMVAMTLSNETWGAPSPRGAGRPAEPVRDDSTNPRRCPAHGARFSIRRAGCREGGSCGPRRLSWRARPSAGRRGFRLRDAMRRPGPPPRFPARMGPAEWELPGPMPMVKSSRTERPMVTVVTSPVPVSRR